MTAPAYNIKEWHGIIAYVLAAVLPIVTLFLHGNLTPPTANHPLVILFMVPVILCALMGGCGPGLLATLAAGGLTAHFLVPPIGHFAGAAPHDLIQWGLLVANGLLVSVLAGFLHRRDRTHLRQVTTAQEGLRENTVRFESRFKQSAMDNALQLKISDERYRTVLEGAADAVLVVDDRGRILLANPQAGRLLGYSMAELMEIGVADITPPDEMAAATESFRKMRAEGALQAEFNRKRKDGSLVSVALNAVRLPDGTYYGSFRDIAERKRAEEARHLLSEGLRQALQPLLLADPNTFITYLNPAFTSLFGYRLEDLKGKAVTEIVPWEERKSGSYQVVQKVMEGTPWHGEVNRIARDGTTIPVLASVGAVRNDREKLIGFVASYQDLRQLRENEASLRNLAQAVEQSPESIVITDLEGRIEYVNAAFLSCTGYDPAEVLGQNPRILHSGKTPGQNYAELWLALTGGQTWKGEFHNRRKDGTEYVEFANISPIRQADGRITHYVAVKEDITEKKWLAQELDQYRNHLEQLVELRTKELREAKTAAEAANLAKSEFLANMSHEIRTPLNAVLGFAQIGLRDSRGRNCLDYFAHILESGQGLLQVINDILDISKLQASGISLERIPVSPGDIMDRSLQLVVLRAQAKDLSMTVKEASGLPTGCLGDPSRLRQVLANLLTNAVKFTPAGGSVTLAAASGHGELTFTVSDTGIGIAPDDIERLFQPFEQADTATTRRYGGTGLGLSISRQLVELMGGTMAVQSVPGRGSHFTVHLPLAGEVAAAAMDALAVIAVGLSDAETQILADGFVRCDVVGDLDHLPDNLAPGAAQAPALVVIDGASLETAAAQVEAALGRGLKLVVVLNPGHPPLTARWANNLLAVERPLRCRHLRQAAAAAAPAARPEAPTARLAGLVVLAAEDNEVNRLVLEDMLRGEGAEAVLCENGEQALEKVRQSAGRGIDVLLTDIQMPEMDGYALARAVTELVPGLPVIGLTAHAMAEDRASCLAAGMVEHIGKPIDLDRMVSAILHYASRRTRPMVFNEAALAARYGGRRDFLCRLVATAITAHGGTAARLREASAARDLPNLRALAHMVKGSAGNLQADRVQNLAAEAEQAARDGADDALPKAEELALAVDDLMAALVRWRDGAA